MAYKKDNEWNEMWSTVGVINSTKKKTLTLEAFNFDTLISVVLNDGSEYMRGYWGMNFDGIQTNSIYMTPLMTDGPTIVVELSDIAEIRHAYSEKFNV